MYSSKNSCCLRLGVFPILLDGCQLGGGGSGLVPFQFSPGMWNERTGTWLKYKNVRAPKQTLYWGHNYGVPSPPKFNVAFYILLFAFYPYISCLTSEFTLSSFNFPRATFKFLPCTFTFSYATFKFKFKFSGFYFQVFAFKVEHLPIKFLLSTFDFKYFTFKFALYIQLLKLYFHPLVIHLW